MNENSRLHVFGRFFFKIRSFTPIPFILLLIYFSRPTFMSVAIGATLLCLGEGLRLWAVGYAGGGTRSRALSAASHLVTTGPYGRLRNPLYLGNLLLSLGTCVLANVYWMVVVLLVGYVVQYAPIIASEETYLRKTCGALYLAYCSVVPRFLPRLRPYAMASAHRFSLGRALKSERRTLTAIACVLLLIAVRQGLGVRF